MDSAKRERAILVLLGFFVSTLAAVLLVPPIAQSLNYHDFADSRTLCGVSNFGNVVSNLAILLGGLSGILFMFSDKAKKTGETFITREEWWPYLLTFIGATSIAFGSAYYHYKPGNETLIWDRLPMSIMFMAFFGAIVAERISVASAKILTVPLILLGMASVVGWALTEAHGAGDLRFYAIVQFFPMLAMPLILWLFPSRYTSQSALWGSMGWYAMAKVYEALDWQVLTFSRGLVSGHTIKHIMCGLSIYWLVRMLKNRRPVAAAAPAKS